MITNDALLEKIKKLEKRVKKLEDLAAIPSDDVLLKDIIPTIKRYDMISASFIQRRFSVGYARAARLLNQLEEKGFISKAEGSKPRKVFLK